MNDADVDTVKRQLLMNISEILEQKGLISEEEKRRMRNIISHGGAYDSKKAIMHTDTSCWDL